VRCATAIAPPYGEQHSLATRSQARAVVLQVLYQDDLNPRVDPTLADAMIEERLGDSKAVEFARGLVAGVRQNRTEIDAAIARAAANWSLGRMAATDRAVLRMGAFEILFAGMARAVAIDEAIELARAFGTAQSAQFVNGVLDALVKGQSTKDKVQSTNNEG
jgi:transcription antitermination protein NusB